MLGVLTSIVFAAAIPSGLPVLFEPSSDGSYVARGGGFEARLVATGVELRDGLRIRFVDANSKAVMTPLAKSESETHYYLGNDPSKWKLNIPNFARVRASGVYRGIDAEFHGNGGGELEYDFIVRPGMDPDSIRVRFEGAQRIHIGAAGELIADLNGGGRYIQAAPVAYQLAEDGIRQPVPVRQRLGRRGEISFVLGRYDRSRELVIDPPVTYATIIGNNSSSSTSDEYAAIAVDRANQAILVGSSNNAFFPTPTGTVRTKGTDCVIVKLNALGTALLATIVLGGQEGDACRAVATDASNNIYVTGETASEDFPRLSQFQTQLKGETDGFVTKFSPNGAQMFFSSYLGGSQFDMPLAIAVDSTGAPYIAGRTTSADFPVLNALRSFPPGQADAFVTKLDPTGSSIVYSTFLGGSRYDSANAIAVDAAGAVYVAGTTGGSGFPVQNPLQTNYDGTLTAGFITKIRPGGASIEYSTYLGGEALPSGCCADTTVNAIAVDSTGQAHAVGDTTSAQFPVTVSAAQRTARGRDGFYIRLSAAGNTAVYSTYLGGSIGDRATGIALDSTGVYISGSTASADFPLIDPFFARPNQTSSFSDGFVMKLSPQGATVLYSSLIGGISGVSQPVGVAVDSTGAAYVGSGASRVGFGLVGVRVIGDPVNGLLVVKVGARGAVNPPPPDPTGSTCIRAFFPNTVRVGAAATNVEFVVDALSTCSWAMQSNVAWAVPNRTSGTGSFIVQLAIQSNTSATERTGAITAGNLRLSIMQAGASAPSTSARPLIRNVVGSAIRESYTPDGVAIANVEIVRPGQVAVGLDGTVYIPEPTTHRIRTVSPRNVWGTVAGSSDTAGFAGDGGPARSARLGSPSAVEVDVAGNLYIMDSSNRRVRIVNPAGTISTFAGGGSSMQDDTGALDFSFFTGIGKMRRDWNGGMYVYMGDLFYIDKDRKVSRIIENRSYRNVQLQILSGMGADARGNLYIADDRANRVYRIDAAGEISVFAGNGRAATSGDGGAAVDAGINAPIDVVADVMGNVYIAERSGYRIRRVAPDGTIETVGGTGTGNLGDAVNNIPATEARLGSVNSLNIDLNGDLYLSEASRIRKITFNQSAQHSLLFAAAGSHYPDLGNPIRNISPSNFIEVLGGGIRSASGQPVTWNDAAGALPVELEGVRVYVNGKPAYVAAASPSYVRALAPAEALRGLVPVHVVMPAGLAWVVSRIVDLTPAVVSEDASYELKSWARIRLVEDTSVVVGRPGEDSSGPLRPGQKVQMRAYGLGPTDPPFPQGEGLTQEYPLASLDGVSVLIGDVEIAVEGVAMTAAGEFQVRFEVPADLRAADYQIKVGIAGLRTGDSIWVRYLP